MSEPLLELVGLHVAFGGGSTERVAVDGVDLGIRRGEMVALVGESGCGKSLTASALLGLAPPAANVGVESYRFDGRSIDLGNADSIRALRGSGIGMVFQDPLGALDPVETIGAQLVETLRVHHPLSRAAAEVRAAELLAEAGLPDPEIRMRMYAHELSGGQRQRATLALALAGDPKLLIADEPTTALDPTLRLALVAHLEQLRRDRGLAILFVTHDLALVAQAAETIAVMYCGRIVELGPRDAVLRAPAHPYTVGLIASAPELGVSREALPTIPGVVPPLGEWPAGCTFAPRCSRATEACRAAVPAQRVHAGRRVACVHPHTSAEVAA